MPDVELVGGEGVFFLDIPCCLNAWVGICILSLYCEFASGSHDYLYMAKIYMNFCSLNSACSVMVQHVLGWYLPGRFWFGCLFFCCCFSRGVCGSYFIAGLCGILRSSYVL